MVENAIWLRFDQDPSLTKKIDEYWLLPSDERLPLIAKRTRDKDYFRRIHNILANVERVIHDYNYDNEADTEVVSRFLKNSLVPYCSFKLINSVVESTNDPVDIGTLIYFFSYRAPFVIKELVERKINIHGFVSNIIATMSDFWDNEEYDLIEKLFRDHIYNLIFIHKLNDSNLNTGILCFSWLIDIFGVNKEILTKSYAEQEAIVRDKLLAMDTSDWVINLGLKYKLTKRQLQEAQTKLSELLEERAGRDTVPTFELTRDDLILRRIPYDDPRQMFLGYNNEYSSCYQIRGMAKTALFYSIRDPGSGNYEIVTNNEEPVLQFMLWTDSTDQYLFIDSLEKGTHYDSSYDFTYSRLLLEFGEKVVSETPYNGVLISSSGPKAIIDFFSKTSELMKKHRPQTKELLGIEEDIITNRFGLYDPIPTSAIPKAKFYSDAKGNQRIVFCPNTEPLQHVYTREYHWSKASTFAEMIRSGDLREEVAEEFQFHLRTALVLDGCLHYDVEVFSKEPLKDILYKDAYDDVHGPDASYRVQDNIDAALQRFIYVYLYEPVYGFMRVCQNIPHNTAMSIHDMENDDNVRLHRRCLRAYYENQTDNLDAFYNDTKAPQYSRPARWVDGPEECYSRWVLSDTLKEFDIESKRDLLSNEAVQCLIPPGYEEIIDKIFGRASPNKILDPIAVIERPDRNVEDRITDIMDINKNHDYHDELILRGYILELNPELPEEKEKLDHIYRIADEIDIVPMFMLVLASQNVEWGLEHHEKITQILNGQYVAACGARLGHDIESFIFLRKVIEHLGVYPLTNEWFRAMPEDLAISLSRVQVIHSFPRKLNVDLASKEQVQEILSNLQKIYKIRSTRYLNDEMEYINSLLWHCVFGEHDGVPSWEELDEFMSLIFNSTIGSLTDEFKEDIMRDLADQDTSFWHTAIYDIHRYLMGKNRLALQGVTI